MNIGGNLEKCPLCQNVLTGEGERDYWPKPVIKTKRKKAFKIVVFVCLCACIISLAMDYIFLKTEHLSFSPLVVLWILMTGWLLENVIKKHYNLLKTVFVAMLTLCLLCQISEFFIHFAWDIPYLGITAGWIIPILCSVNIVSNFVLSFVDKHFTDHSLIYMFANILVGVVPWIGLFFYQGMPPLTWSVCMVINVLAFVALFVFRGRTTIEEFKKRFHV